MYPRTSADTCIPHWIPHVSRMYSLCILILSWSVVMTCPRYMYRDEASKIHVFWCILICIQCDIKEAHKIHVSWCILRVSQTWSQMYLGLVWDTCKIHVKYQDTCTCILLECNRAFKINLRYIKIHPGYMYSTGYMQDTCKIHHDTTGYVSDRKSPQNDRKPPAPLIEGGAGRGGESS